MISPCHRPRCAVRNPSPWDHESRVEYEGVATVNILRHPVGNGRRRTPLASSTSRPDTAGSWCGHCMVRAMRPLRSHADKQAVP